MGLRAYIIRRILLLIPILIGVSLLIFAITMLFSPVARASLYLTNPEHIRPEQIPNIIKKYGLDDPVYIQYFRWLKEVLSGNLGYSKTARMPVLTAIITKVPATLELTLFTSPFIVLVGIYLGVKSAVHRDKPIDHMTRTFSIIGWSLPSFWFGIVLLSVFYGGFHLFPPRRLGTVANVFVETSGLFRRYTGLNTIDALLNGQLWIFWDALQHLVLPVIVLTTIQIALIVRVMRSSMLESLGKGYVVMARAKGLTEKEIINKHARRNALIPTITLSGLVIAGMLNGVIITETVFNYQGVGWWAATAALALDIPAVLGFALFSGTIFVFANLIVDILYAVIDPRIRLG